MNFKRFGTGLATVLMVAAPLSAQAADMVIPRPVYKGGVRPVVAYYNWTGFYVGIVAGYGFGNSDWTTPAISMEPTGFMVGGTIGYNYQVGSIVYGLEGDFSWSGMSGDATCFVAFTCETKNDWFGTARVRLGYAFDRWLPYVTGGAAFGNIEASSTAPGFAGGGSDTAFGWTAGVGLEYAFLSNWTAKIEYLYADLGSIDVGTAPVTNSVTFNANIVRLGLNYKFAGPIFSRY
jgi:outer membrane immunogenic protein